MKLKQLNSSQIQIQVRTPDTLAGGLLLILIQIGLLSSCGVSLRDWGTQSLACERVEPQQVNCFIDKQYWLGMERYTQQVTHVKQATLEVEETDDSKVYKVFILSREGKTAANIGSNYTRKNDADQINTFLKSRESTFLIRRDAGLEVYVVSFISVLFLFTTSIILFIVTQFPFEHRWIFDRNLKQIQHQEISILSWLFGKTRPSSIYPLTNVLEIQIDNTQDPGDSDSSPFYYVYLKRETFSRLELFSGRSDQLQILQSHAQSIGDFLGIPASVDPIFSRDRKLEKGFIP